MSDLTITPADVKSCGDPDKNTFLRAIAGATLAVGESVRINAGEAFVSSDDSAANAAAVGIVVVGGDEDDPVVIQTGGFIDLGVDLQPSGQRLIVGTDGGIAPEADEGTFITTLGTVHSATVLELGIIHHGA